MAAVTKRITPNGTVSYQAKVRVKGYPPQSATFDRKTDAIRWAQRKEAEIREDKHFPNAKAKKHTVPELIDRYLDYMKANNLRRHNEVKYLLDWWKEEAGKTALAYFKSEHVLKGQQKLMNRQRWGKEPEDDSRPLSPATVNRYMVVLRTVFAFGIKKLKWIEKNPLDGLDKLKESKGRTRYLRKEEDEVNRLLNACKASKNRYLFAVALIALATGARRGEIQNMRWVDVNESCTAVTLPKTKNGEIRSVAFGRIAELVKKMREEKEEGQMFLFPSSTNPKKPMDFRAAWRFAVKEAELEDFRFHDLRHTCGSYLAMNGASTVEIAAALGHKTLQMVKRYAHVSEPHTSAIVNKMTEEVETLMNELLSSVPKDKVILWKTRNRLYELAYALYFAGENAKKYTAPLKKLMSRKVQSFALQFGMLELYPKRMCRVLEGIEGSGSLKNYSYCTDDNIPFEQ